MTRNPHLPIEPVTTPVQVAIVSDDPLLRAGLGSLLAQSADVSVVDLEGAEVALWDPGADPARTAGRLGELTALRVPAVAVLADGTHLGAAIAAGARGVVLRDQVGSGLVAALVAVRSGLTVIDTALAGQLATGPGHEAAVTSALRGGIDELTAREREVVQLLSEGLSNKLIAARLDISEHTAKFHVNSILGKLGASTRTEAVVEALRRGHVLL
jgi:DNA-binding NarL/FixJ family response regulator